MRLRAAIYVTLFVTHLRPLFSQTKADVMNFDFTNVNDFLALEDRANETELGFDFGDGLCVPQDPLEDIEFFPNFSNGWIRPKPERKGVNSFSVVLARDDDIHKGVLGKSNVEEKTLITESKMLTVFSEHDDADKGLQRSNVEEKTLIQESVREQETKAQAKIDFETLIPESNGDQEPNAKKAKIDETLIQESTSEKELVAKPEVHFKTLIPELTAKQDSKAYIGCSSSSKVVKKRPRSHSNRKRNSLLENTQPDENRNFYFPRPKDANRNPFRAENKYIERTCSHCKVRETPQWREGPHGPKTLCNACGIKYKNGRLVEGYMPAASPSFDINKHSNFHRRIVQKKSSDQDYLGQVVDM